MFELPDVTGIVAAALAEDLGVEREALASSEPSLALLERDVTTAPVVGFDARFFGTVVAREECVVAGLPVAAAVFEALSAAVGLFEPVEFFPLVAEGARVSAGTAVAEVDGLAAVVLSAERTALDFLMVLSGIATETKRWVEAAPLGLAVCDTRKTYPGLRALSKYAVRVGGGTNHRDGLHDMVLIKDNHLRHATIAEAIGRADAANPGLLVEVEADTEAQALEAVIHGADVVLLDNMDDDTTTLVATECLIAAADRGRSLIVEASGNITRDRLQALGAAGVGRVSSSALTLAPPVDFGLDEA